MKNWNEMKCYKCSLGMGYFNWECDDMHYFKCYTCSKRDEE